VKYGEDLLVCKHPDKFSYIIIIKIKSLEKDFIKAMPLLQNWRFAIL